MRFAQQFFTASIPTSGLQAEKTSSLLTNGLVAHFSNAGIPFYMPVGKAILGNIEKILGEEAEEHGFNLIDIPAIMENRLLEGGQEVGEQFRGKFMFLTDRMEGYHLLSTPEMLFVEMAGSTTVSHKQLPVRQAYMTDFFRQIHDARSILKGKQFRVFGGASLEKDEAGAEQALQTLRSMTEAILERMGLPYHLERHHNGLDCEYFYLTDKEGDNLPLPGVDPQNRTKALSLAMAYEYEPDKKLPMRYRTAENKNAPIRLVTYGLGTQRLLYCVMDHYRDEKGFNLPAELRPFDIHLIPRTQGEEEAAEELYKKFKKLGWRVMLDDRYKFSIDERKYGSDYLGTPASLAITPDGLTLSFRDGRDDVSFNTATDLESYLKLTQTAQPRLIQPF